MSGGEGREGKRREGKARDRPRWARRRGLAYNPTREARSPQKEQWEGDEREAHHERNRVVVARLLDETREERVPSVGLVLGRCWGGGGWPGRMNGDCG